MLLATDRLILREWIDSDRAPFSKLNADPRVMEFLPKLLCRQESDAFADRIATHFQRHGFGLCAAELRASHAFIGFIGFAVPTFKAAFTPCVEIGWRLSAEHWGQGLATEGAQALVQYAFEILRMDALVSFTVPQNLRSRRIMEKLGMTHDAQEDFDHPGLPAGHLLLRHVLYRLQRADYFANAPITR